MAEDNLASQSENEKQEPAQEGEMAHSTYPPPPDIQFSRPKLPGQQMSQSSANKGSYTEVKSESFARAGAGMAAGVTFAASIIAGFLIGQWIDNHWIHASFPWGMLIFTLLGVAAGFINLMRLLTATDRKK